MKILLAVTTYNQIEYTKKFLNHWNQNAHPNVNLIFIDDKSTDGTVKWLKEQRHNVITRKAAKGLTWSWNIAYRIFKEKGYDYLIIANNDILIPNGVINNLVRDCKDRQIICPMSTKNGAGHNWKEQAIEKHFPKLKNQSDSFANYQVIQNTIQDKGEVKTMSKFNGFFFMFSRSIIESEFNSKNLFDPKFTNVHQEGDLQKRLKTKPALSTSSFIFHFKGVSFPKKGLIDGKDIRQNLNLYH